MTYYRQIIDGVAETITVPIELRHRRVEIIILALDEAVRNGAVHHEPAVAVDANGWPLGFFEETFGALPDFPEREPQGNLVTHNTAEFSRITGLQLEDWE